MQESIIIKRGVQCLLAIFVLSFVGCYNSFDAAPTDGDVVEVECNMTLKRLGELLASREWIDIEDDVVVCGSVTANDVGGNFYSTFVIEQDGYSLEVMEGLNYNYVRYPEGSVVAVQLGGLRLARKYGILQAGLAASVGSYYDLEYLGSEILVDRHILATGVFDWVEPLCVTLEKLCSNEQFESMCGRLVCVESVRFLSEEYELEDMVWSGSKCFTDAEGHRLGVYTSEYSNYSMVEIEEGYHAMVGILEYGEVNGQRMPMIKMRVLEDYLGSCATDGNISNCVQAARAHNKL